MVQEIKNLRTQCDGLAQLTKELKPFKDYVYLNNQVVNEEPEINGSSGFIKVENSQSKSPNNFKYKYHSLVRTKEGSFRIGHAEPININDFTFNFDSKEIEKAVDSLYLAKAWLGKLLGEINKPTGAEHHKKYIELGGHGALVGNESKEVLDKEAEVQKQLKEWEANYGNPYGSGYKTKEDIVPTQDVAFKLEITKDDEGVWYSLGKRLNNHIERVDWLREQINILHMEVTSMLNRLVYEDKGDGELKEIRSYVKQHLSEARFWLGFEMERIKKED